MHLSSETGYSSSLLGADGRNAAAGAGQELKLKARNVGVTLCALMLHMVQLGPTWAFKDAVWRV